jgi:purine-cytosine permease-like protein
MAGLGAPLGYVAIITGQIFLFVYSGLIAHKGAQYGLNFPLMCKAAFGRYGYAIPTLMIAGLVAGWFAFQAWLAADLMVGWSRKRTHLPLPARNFGRNCILGRDMGNSFWAICGVRY